MILQPTSPFRCIQDIKKSIQVLESNPLTTCVASVFKLSDHHPRRIKLINKDGFLDDFVMNIKSQSHLEDKISRQMHSLEVEVFI